MGREAKAKAERRAAAKVAAWEKGIATVVKLTPEGLEMIQRVISDRVTAEQAIAQIRSAIAGRMQAVMQAAGLHPERNYRFNAETLTAELVE